MKPKRSGAAPGMLLVAVLLLWGSSASAAALEPLAIRFIGQAQAPPDMPEEEWVQKRADEQRELAKAGARAVPAILELLATTKSDFVKSTALTTLTMMQSPEALRAAAPSMVPLLGEKNPATRYLAAQVLGLAGHRFALPQLHQLAADKEFAVRIAVADALGRIGDPSSEAALLALLDAGTDEGADESARGQARSLRLHATEAIAKLGVALKVVPRLIAQLESADVNDREAAADAIKELLGYDIREDQRWIISHSAEMRAPFIERLKQWWEAAVTTKDVVIRDEPELTLRLNICRDEKQKPAIRQKAAEVIGKLGNAETALYLEEILYTKDPAVRKAVAAVASKLSGIPIEYRDSDTDVQWLVRVQEWGSKVRKRSE